MKGKVISLFIILSSPILGFGQTFIFPPKPTGIYSVGFKNLLFERVKSTNEIRQLNTWFFYPSQKPKGEEKKKYASDALLVAMRQEKYLNFSDSTFTNWATIKTNSFENSPPVNKKFPVIFILHGRGSSKINYTALAEEICSHGYIVVISDHPGSGLTIRKDGSKVVLKNPSDLNDEVNQMSADVCFLVEKLSKSDLCNTLMDTKNMGIIGHSLGSMAMFNLTLDNCGFKAAINFDGYPFGEAVNKGINIPHLTLWGELPTRLSVPADTLRIRRYKIWKDFTRVSNPDFLIVKVKGMYHTDFNDLLFLKSKNDRAANPGSIDADRGYRITIDLTVAYLNYRLKSGKQSDVLNTIKNTPELSIDDLK